jgi:MerR family transcriptional regulator, light-induced transcriptional regulator
MRQRTALGVRVGELARRVGVSPETLRAWERRYGVLQPARTPGGYRVYDAEDELRARRMRELIASGWAAGEAAQAIAATTEAVDGHATVVTGDDPAGLTAGAVLAIAGTHNHGGDELLPALLGFDCHAAQMAFDRVFAVRSMDAALRDVVLPALQEVGDRWARGEITVAHEHFATELIGGRLRSLGWEWDSGLGPRAILACPATERHDIGLLCCALALHYRGWRVTYLGPDTPADALEAAVDAVDPEIVIIGAVQRTPLRLAAPALAQLATRVPVAVGGAGVNPELAAAAGAQLLHDDPISAAQTLTEIQLSVA